ncbi:transposase family protein [Streptomyces sodiiphilus]|uniref:transposase family protein n=1 Tax=Streptomyces sodiiphilus TaxID=226217 RepID=UPI003CD070CB
MPSSSITAAAPPRPRCGRLPRPRADPCRAVDVADVLVELPDPRRRQGRRFRLGSVLAVCTLAVLGGARTLAAITRFHRRTPTPPARPSRPAGCAPRQHRLPAAGPP